MQHFVSDESAYSMHRRLLTVLYGLLSFLCCHVPYDLVYLVVFQLVKYTIGPNQQVVVLIDSILLVYNLRLANDHSFLSSKVSELSLTITKRPANGETAREHSVRANEGVVFIIRIFGWRHCLLLNLLSLRRWKPIAHDCLSLVNVATRIIYSLELTRIGWLVICRHLDHFGCCLYLVLEGAIFVDISVLDRLLMNLVLRRYLGD